MKNKRDDRDGKGQGARCKGGKMEMGQKAQEEGHFFEYIL